MAFLEWKSNMSVGVAAMDAQHQKLIQLINQLAEAMSAGKGNLVLQSVLTELVTYTKTHFASEEGLLSKNNYPEYGEQKTEHDHFTKKIVDFQTQFKEGKIALSIELMNFLREWLLDHIQGRDKRYGVFLNSKSIS